MAIYNMVAGKNAPNLQTKSESYTPTESVQTDQITPNVGYDGLDEVNVTVGAISSTYVGSGIPQRSSANLSVSGSTVTAPSGYYASNASASVAGGTATPAGTLIGTGADIDVYSPNTITLESTITNSPQVSAGYISTGTAGNTAVALTANVSTRSSADLSVSGSTITAPAGYYASSASASVAGGTAGTPTATKGAVNNHSITVTPSVTNTTGYITGGTKTGTGVTVSASELVSGTYNVTGAGTANVTNYASISVPSGTAGTPTATKGTVSGHSVSVTPAVTNVAGYIAGGTLTGTAVNVTASELVSGNLSITSNASGIDVTNYASVDVDVAGGGTGLVWQDASGYIHISSTASGATCILKSITSNGVYTASDDGADGYSVVDVNVAGGGGYTIDDIALAQISGAISGSASKISPYAFMQCSLITGASFPNATLLGNSAFCSCSNLSYANFPIATVISNNAFAQCTALTAYSATSVVSVGGYGFSGCAISEFSAPNATSLGNYAFYRCSNLTNVYVPNALIGGATFMGCYNLSNITCTSASRASASTFQQCSALSTISLPNVTSVGTSAFYDCWRLLSVYLMASTVATLVNTNGFGSTPIAGYTDYTGGVYGSIYVPSSLYNSYITATNWSDYAARITSV